MEIVTTRDLRRFLVDVMVDVRDGKVKSHEAQAIANLAAKVNQSLSIEVSAALKQGLEQGAYVDAEPMLLATPQGGDAQGMIWCEQCDKRVAVDAARSCKSQHCKAKAAA